MVTPTRPTNIDLPFASSGDRNVIPDAATGSELASYTEGFPPVTRQPISSGGIPPHGKDMNGILYALSKHILWLNAGGQYRFDAALSTSIGGYPKDMVLQADDGSGSYISLVDSNTDNFNTDPSSIGMTWGAWSGASHSIASIATTGGNTTLTTAQCRASVIEVTGTLISNVTLTFPAVADEYTVVNKTTGAFTVTCTPLAGSGVPIVQGCADDLYSDGSVMRYRQGSAATRNAKDAGRAIANTLYADRAADRVGGGYTDTGVANAYVIATVPSSSSGPVDFQTVRFRAANPSSGAPCTLDVGSGALPLICGDGNDPRFGDISNTAITTATYVAAINKWIINGLIVPDILLSNAIWVTSTRTVNKGNFNFSTAGGAYGCNLNSTPSVGDTVYGTDPTGDWDTNPLTIAATGGIQIAYRDATKVLQTMSTLTCNVRGWRFQLTYDGTYWRLS